MLFQIEKQLKSPNAQPIPYSHGKKKQQTTKRIQLLFVDKPYDVKIQDIESGTTSFVICLFDGFNGLKETRINRDGVNQNHVQVLDL
jgi:hypothetical protein